MMRKENEQFVFGCLFLLANKIQSAGDQVIPGITLKQWFLLMMITKMEKDSPSLTEIAEFIGSTRQNVKKMVDILERQQFVITKRLEEDKRNVGVSVTEKVHILFRQYETAGDGFLDVLFTNVPEADLVCVRQTFMTILENLSTQKQV